MILHAPNPPRLSLSRRAVRAAASLLLAGTALVLAVQPSVALAQPIDSGFPRLNIWWPNSDAQPVADRARCDWTALQNSDARHIPELRAANPAIRILGSTSASELNYRLNDYNDPLNVELRSASTDWMLTQVGSRLTANITNSATTIPVADPKRFAAGEMALCDHELVHIVSVGSSSLTVTRGQVTPTSAHASGARIASLVSWWPGALTLDLSTGCPEANVGYGPETWADWNVRRGRAVLNSADWDGLLIDCMAPNPRFLVTSGQNRSIDPDRSNTLVGDDYAAFDAAWNAGAVAYGNALKAAAGGKALIGNGNLRNYNLNGTIFEEFPYSSMSLTDWNLVFVGPYAYPHASYPEWCVSAQDPNLTLIQTYGAKTDYRLVRFGLCSTLMSDGFFSYALSSSGHARNGIWWYDEYDNAGAGRGFLGQPTGAARPVGTNVYRRDYTGGAVLVNSGSSAQTVQLGDTFRKIKGSQAPSTNDGSLVSAVTVPARDGIVLLSATAPSGTFSVAGGAGRVVSPEVAYACSVTGAVEMRFDPGSGTFGAWAPYAASGSVDLFAQPGTRTVRAEFRNSAGATSLLSDAVELVDVSGDRTAPQTTSDAVATYVGSAKITLRASDQGGSGVAATHYVLDGGEQMTGTVVGVSSAGTHVMEFWSVDAAGNSESPRKSASFVVKPGPVPTTVTIGSSRYSLSLGMAFVLRGRLVPGRIGDGCIVDVKRGSTARWAYSSTRKVYTAAGDWRYLYRPKARGTYYFRVRFRGSPTRLPSTSSVIRVVVR
jgi:hypothetical protein